MTTLKDSIFSVEECLQRAKVREAKREKHQSLESSTISDGTPHQTDSLDSFSATSFTIPTEAPTASSSALDVHETLFLWIQMMLHHQLIHQYKTTQNLMNMKQLLCMLRIGLSHKIGIHYSLFLLYCGICYTMNFITQLIGDVRGKGERTIRDWRAKFV